MKQITVSLYKFDELSEDAQQKALEQFGNINLDYDWWNFVYDDFKTIAAYFGITVDLKKTYFAGFYHQGQGSSYTADVDVLKMLDCFTKNSWREYAPKQEFNFIKTKIDKRILSLVERGLIDIRVNVRPIGREKSIAVNFEPNFSYNQCINYYNIEKELDKLEELVTDVCEELNHFLFNQLRDEYNYLSSGEAVKETIIANEYDFAQDGKYFIYR